MIEKLFSGMERHKSLGFSLHRVAPAWDYLPHTHDFHELEIVLSGRAINSINDVSFPIGAGDVFVVEKGATHAIYQPDGLELFNVGFLNSAVRLIGTDLLQLPGVHALFLMGRLADPSMRRLQLPAASLEQIKNLLNELLEEYEQNLPGCNTALLCGFSKLIVLLSRNYPQNGEQHTAWRIAVAAAKMERDFSESISVAELAESVQMSERHFRRQFETFYHVSPSAYLLRLRMEAARKLLLQENLSITQVALACGFSDCNYFSRIFRQQTGETPSDYRSREAKWGYRMPKAAEDGNE